MFSAPAFDHLQATPWCTQVGECLVGFAGARPQQEARAWDRSQKLKVPSYARMPWALMFGTCVNWMKSHPFLKIQGSIANWQVFGFRGQWFDNKKHISLTKIRKANTLATSSTSVGWSKRPSAKHWRSNRRFFSAKSATPRFADFAGCIFGSSVLKHCDQVAMWVQEKMSHKRLKDLFQQNLHLLCLKFYCKCIYCVFHSGNTKIRLSLGEFKKITHPKNSSQSESCDNKFQTLINHFAQI